MKKFSAIKERFRSPAFFLRRLFLNANESDIAEILDTVVVENKDVTFGSYPILDNPEYKIIVTAESMSLDTLNKSVDGLLNRLPKDIVVGVE